jgi:hypothetical protein
MDSNKKASNIPVSELTPENIETIKKESGIDKPVKIKTAADREGAQHRLILVIIATVLLVGVAVALYFIFRQPTTDNQSSKEEEPTEINWQPSVNSTDPGQEYVKNHQATVDNPDATTDEKLDAQLSIANLYSVTNRYQEAESILNGINRDNLTHRQLFNLYSAYSYLYEHSGDETARKEYTTLTEEILSVCWPEETDCKEVTPTENPGEE